MGNKFSHLNFGKFAQKGNIPWNKGKKGVQIVTDETRKKLSLLRKDEKHWNWRDGSCKEKIVGYRALHSWIARKLGENNKCSLCLKIFSGRKIHWANISGKYKRELSDWIRLCSKCHGVFDKVNKLRGKARLLKLK